VRQEASGEQRPSLPRLVDVDWRIDIKQSSQQMRKLPPIPSLLLELEVGAWCPLPDAGRCSG
jgi:hypothetical protein